MENYFRLSKSKAGQILGLVPPAVEKLAKDGLLSYRQYSEGGRMFFDEREIKILLDKSTVKGELSKKLT